MLVIQPHSLLYPLGVYLCAVWIFSSKSLHYSAVIMGHVALQITSLKIVYWTVYWGADLRKHQSSASLDFEREYTGRGIHRWPVNSPHKRRVTRKMFPFDDVIMSDLRGWNQRWHDDVQRTRSTQIQVKACRLIGANPLPAKMVAYCPLGTSFEAQQRWGATTDLTAACFLVKRSLSICTARASVQNMGQQRSGPDSSNG